MSDEKVYGDYEMCPYCLKRHLDHKTCKETQDKRVDALKNLKRKDKLIKSFGKKSLSSLDEECDEKQPSECIMHNSLNCEGKDCPCDQHETVFDEPICAICNKPIPDHKPANWNEKNKICHTECQKNKKQPSMNDIQ